MADYNLGTARGTIQIDYNGAGPKKAQEDMDAVASRSQKVDQALSSTARVAGRTGLLLGAGLAVAANSAANFEQRLSAIQAVSGATGKEMDQISSKALQLGKDTQFSASESAQAIEELIKAGLSVSDVINGAADATVNLAAAGSIDMPQAATIASNAMNQFGLAAENMPKVVDAIAGAANASAIDVGEFGQSLSQVGAVANLAGLSFEDTAVAIAEMGNAGIKGSDAGTSLKSMLSRLQPETDKAKNLMHELGLTTEDGTNKFYDQEGKLKSLRDIQELLGTSLEGMSQQQKQAALQTLFGADAIRAAAILADNGAAGYDKLSTAMGKVTAADVAKTKMDNLKGSIEQLKGSAETLGIALGTIIVPALRQITDALIGVIDWFNGLSEGQQKALVTGVAAATGMLLMLAAMIKLAQAIKATRDAMAILRTTMIATKAVAAGQAAFGAFAAGLTGATTGGTFMTKMLNILGRGLRAAAVAMKAFTLALLTNPIFLIIAAIVALIAIFVVLYKKNEAFRNFINKVWEGIKSVIGGVVSWITGTLVPGFVSAFKGIQKAVSTVVNFIKNHWKLLLAIFLGPITLVVAAIIVAFRVIKTIITTVLAVIMGIWQGFWTLFGGLITAVWQLIVAIIQLNLAIIMAIIGAALMVLKAIWDLFWNTLKIVVSAVWTFIVAYVTTYLNILKAIITTVLNVIKAVFSAVWNAIKAVTSAVWNAIKAVISSVVRAFIGIVSGPVNAVKGVISAAWNAVKTATSKVWNALKGIVSGAIDGVMTIVKGIKSKVTGAFSGAAGWLKDAGVKIITGLISGITSKVKDLTGKLKSITGLIPDWKGPESVDKKLLEPAGRWIMEGLTDGIDDGSKDVFRTLAGLTRAIPTEVDPVINSMVKTNAQITQADASRFTVESTKEKGDKVQRISGDLDLRNGRPYIEGIISERKDSDQEFYETVDKTRKP